MKRGTFFLNVAIFLIVTPILGFFIFVLPRVITGLSEVIPVSAYLRYPGLIALNAAVIPFLFALYQAIKLFIHFYKNKAYSVLAAKALQNIKYSSITISVLYVAAMPLLFLMGDADDAPGIILFGLIVILVNGVSAIYAAAFEKRWHRYKIG